MARDTTAAVLLLSCQDQKGLVAGTSDFIYRNNGNIVHADQHVDAEAGLFLQRIEWELADFRIPRAELTDVFRPIAEKFGMQWELHFSDYVPRVAIFVSRLEHCLYDLLLRHRMGELEGEIPLVISNHPDLEQFVETFGPKYHFFPITKETKAAQELKQIELLEEQRIDLVVLARYMQILGGEFVSRFRNRAINIHHSFLPAFPGGRPYHQAYERGVKIIGATSHYVTEDLDEGPIIEQDVVRVSHRDSVEDLIRKGKDLERVVLARALSLHLRHRILIYGNKTVVFD
ncbi:MAG: formyltetrahydrofolate deformylase [Dehalococcoidia bacterium]|jgi:formyltetrahydrofolate deformylase|nr:formyltetrahydrofolate deformylase [Dehalococcoidia bacterium]